MSHLQRNCKDALCAETSPEANNEGYRAIVEHCSDGIVVVDEQGMILYANVAAKTLLDRSEMIGESFGYPVVPGTMRELELSAPASNRLVVEMRASRTSWEGTQACVISLHDISARKEAEEQMARREKQWERTFDSVIDIVTLQDASMRILMINRSGCELLGEPAERVRGRRCYEIFHDGQEPCPGCPILETQKDFQPYVREMYNEKMDKTFLVSAIPVFDSSGELLHIAHIAKDISEQKELEKRVLGAERMKTVAGLAAGVAHEINTPLSAILQAEQVVEMALAPDSPSNRELAAACGVDLEKVADYLSRSEISFFLEGIKESATRADQIVKSLLGFSRPQEGQIALVDLEPLIQETIQLVQTDYDLKHRCRISDVRFVAELASDLPQIKCIPLDLQQVLINLIKNAVQALHDDGPKEADNSGEGPCVRVKTWCRGDRLHLEVADNGPGVEEAIGERIFEPFFSTKEQGAGSGLGLSICQTLICNKHGGTIQLDPGKDKGARFMIELPLQRSEKENG